MKTRIYLWLIAIQVLFAGCRNGGDNCNCAIPPIPRPGELDSVFYIKSLGMKAIISIQTKPDGAVVSLDGKEIGTTPFHGIKLVPGKHKLGFAVEGNNEMIFFDTTMEFDSGHTDFSIELKSEFDRIHVLNPPK